MKEKVRRKKSAFRTFGINPQRFHASQLKFHVYLVPMCVFMALPIVFIFMNALKPMDELFAYPPRFFVRHPTLENFTDLFSMASSTNMPASRYLFNSIISTVSVVFLTLIISVCAGYVFSKKRFKGKQTLYTINMLGLMFVSIAVAIPRYFIVVYTGLQNNFLANIIPLLAMPTGVFLVKQFIDQLPDALVDAAVIDGATDFQIVRKIIVPLTAPALATVAILTFQSAWNTSEASSLYLDNESLKTFSFYMSTLSSSAGGISGTGIAAAATLIMFIPNLVIFIFMQSRVMNTMANSGIK